MDYVLDDRIVIPIKISVEDLGFYLENYYKEEAFWNNAVLGDTYYKPENFDGRELGIQIFRMEHFQSESHENASEVNLEGEKIGVLRLRKTSNTKTKLIITRITKDEKFDEFSMGLITELKRDDLVDGVIRGYLKFEENEKVFQALFGGNNLPKEISMVLKTTPILFSNWLEKHTRMLPYQDFPTEKGRICARKARPSHRQYPDKITIEGDYVYPTPGEPKSETAQLFSNLIVFDIIQLSTERIEVKARCNQPVLYAYFIELLGAISERWPEAQNTIESQLEIMRQSRKPRGPDIGAGKRGGGRPEIPKKPNTFKNEFSLPTTAKDFWRWFDNKYPRANGWIRTPLGNGIYEISHLNKFKFWSKIKTIG